MSSEEPHARKFFVSMLDDFEVTEGDDSIYYRNHVVKHVWLQGVIIHCGEEDYALDDGTGAIYLLTNQYTGREKLERGMYATIIGTIEVDNDKGVNIGVHQIAPHEDPNREALWNLEVVDVFTRFYNKPP